MPEARSLWDLTEAAGLSGSRFVADAAGRLDLAIFGKTFGDEPHLRGATVLISADRQLPAVAALLALDGLARRILLCPADLPADHLPALMNEAAVDYVVGDGTGPAARANIASMPVPGGPPRERGGETEWLLLTSGTTGRPKLVVHTLGSLAGPLAEGPAAEHQTWSTFYDVRRYGGLQILLRALLGGGSLVLSQSGEDIAAFLARLGAARVTHILGTPSHWRRALISGEIARIAPRYVRLSGEVADQPILDRLASVFPDAGITHAFASTEAGVGFEVTDRLAGFPDRYVGATDMPTEIRVVDSTLRLRSARTGSHYLGTANPLADAEGFVDTGDVVEHRGSRYHFAGRREGVINVGGHKVYPEEVEAVVARHPAVDLARAYPRPSHLVGSLVALEIVLKPSSPPVATVCDEVLRLCREHLQSYKVPTLIKEVGSIALTPSGKVARPRA